MKHIMYSVYDRVAETYGPMTEFANDRVAIRSFKEACNLADGMKNHPTDLELHRIGTFDDGSGSLTENKEILEKGE